MTQSIFTYPLTEIIFLLLCKMHSLTISLLYVFVISLGDLLFSEMKQRSSVDLWEREGREGTLGKCIV